MKKTRYRVKNEYNGIVIENNFEEKQFFHGRGAGGFPTATALLNDISSLKEDYHYSYPKIGQHRLSSNALLRVY